ncbi:4-hydroxybenzoyl-CoA thioesterase family active site [Geomicrobium sp. JCM 19037]|uniref:acyl-CoA thioesterase n=1 Tax=Geomicrobium sp. JCM 19037 TaxID=1460634 RepID=UPI00045F167C|nr:thioesterase family protein [Geomicrobium sp. JCM 19037]GAK01960.1 4-hydroxybenzoyl-CoA thioesterase family active site [Geomicrobium sp. JCM 19037]
MTTSNTIIQTRYAETDQMGVIHHSQYLIWCEIGRTDFIEKLGFSYTQMEQDGLLAPVTEVNLQYKQALRYPETAHIATWLSDYTGIRATYAYTITNDKGQVCVEGTTTHVVVTADRFRPVSMKKVAPEWHRVYENEVQSKRDKL